MRYILQIIVMMVDIVLFLAAGVVLYSIFSKDFNLAGSVIMLFLVLATITGWYRTGGFATWRPSKVKQFMKNAKKIGL